MSNLQFKKSEVNEIQFYVRNDGGESGMSIRGLARCCGVSHKAIQNLLEIIVANKSPHEIFKPFAGAVFAYQKGGEQNEDNVKIIRHEVCAAVITYYAHYSRVANKTAKHTLVKFASIGMDKWIKEITGFSKEDKTDMILGSLNEVLSELKEIKHINAKYNTIRETTTVNFPGIDEMLTDIETKELTDQHILDHINKQEYVTKGVTTREYLSLKGIDVTHGTACKYGRMVAEVYKACSRKQPVRTHRKIKKGKYERNLIIYSVDDLPLLEMAYRKLVGIK